MTIKDKLGAARAAAAFWLPDALMVGGAAAMSYGAWLVYSPAGFIVAGAFAIVAGIQVARAGAEE